MLRALFRALVLQPLSLVFSLPFSTAMLKKMTFPGKANIAWRLKIRGHATCEIDRFKLHLDLTNPIHRLFALNCFEENNIAYALSVIKPGDTCLDIGANIGYFSFKMARACGDKGKVYAFEPSPEIFQALSHNIQLNPTLPVEAHPVALSSKCMQVGYVRPPKDNSGNGRVVHHSDHDCPYIVQAITLDAFMQENNISSAKFLKIDIEGSEMEMLRGAQQALTDKLFEHIMIEYNEPLQAALGFTLDHLIQEVTQYGYKIQPTPQLEAYRKYRLKKNRAVFDLFFHI